ncbi:MAG: hypothetical protein M3N29_06725 [Chloroflexota bacterium]|nr:hypothetical protein [Chloroflexota bacterium]
MTEQYIVWALIVGISLGVALYWFAFGRLPRRSEDISAEERAAEAARISQAIAQRGGFAPPDLVEEVLELHSEYLAGRPMDTAGRPTTDDGDVAADRANPQAGEPPGS